nr:DUF3048 domain-containing protein [uncultured Acetatifactor sp.]
MKRKVLAAIVIAMGMLAGCGGNDENSSVVHTVEGQPIADETQQAGGQQTAGGETITERTVVDGQMQSYLTGEWKDEEVVKRRNMAVMLPNNKPSLPQYGISRASIIYEAPVEGRVTRLMALFEDYDDLDHIGPVRSARDYYVYEAMAYDSIYVNWGLAIPFVGPIINSDRIDNVSEAVSGIDVGAPEAFDRISRSGYSTEYTGYMFIDGYEEAVERLGYETEYTDRFVQAFTFAGDGRRAEYAEYPDATEIYPGGTTTNNGGYGNANPCFTYNEEDGLYYRSQYGEPHIDEMNGEQLAVSNVVFKICHGEVRDPSELDYLAFEVHGQGDAIVFTNGKVIKGTWQRDGDYEPNLFLDENGNEIVFNQGKTWICNIWEEYSQYISYE